MIKKYSGEVITEPITTAPHWKNHNGTTGSSTLFESIELEPPPLKSKVEWAFRQTHSGKSPSPDNVSIELIKESGDAGLKLMHRVCVGVRETGKWPEDWKSQPS